MTELEIKAAVRERDGHKCRDCGMTAQAYWEQYGKLLDVHRLTPGSDYTLDGTITVCRPCHGKRHVKPKLSKRSKMLLDTTREIRMAVQLAAYSQGVSVSQFIADLIRKTFPVEIEDARKYLPKKKRIAD